MLIEAFVRRVNLTGLSAAAKSLRTRMFRRRIYFAHIPKSGGTSLSHMMRARYPVSYFKLDEDASREACPGAAGEWMRFKSRMASYHAALGRNFVQAHAPVTRMMLDRFADEYQFVTILRDPVDRALSSYFFDPRLRAMTPEAFVKSERFSIEANVLGHFFGELDWDGGGDANRAVARAIENLERFDVVGLLEYDEDLSRQFREKIGFQVRLPKRNVGSNRTDNDIEAWLRGPLTEACAHDYRIYNHFAARVAAPSVDGGANAGLVGSGAGS